PATEKSVRYVVCPRDLIRGKHEARKRSEVEGIDAFILRTQTVSGYHRFKDATFDKRLRRNVREGIQQFSMQLREFKPVAVKILQFDVRDIVLADEFIQQIDKDTLSVSSDASQHKRLVIFRRRNHGVSEQFLRDRDRVLR